MSDDFDSRLLDLFYGELTPEEAQAVEAELSQDAAAKQTVAGWHRVREAVKDLPVPEPDPQVHYTILRAAREAVEPAKPKGLWAWLSGLALNPAIAGVAVMALAVGSVMFFQLNEDTPESALDKAADTPAFAANAPAKGEPEFRAKTAQQGEPTAKPALKAETERQAEKTLPASEGRRSDSANNRAPTAALPRPAEAAAASNAVDSAADEDALLRLGDAEASRDSAQRGPGGRRGGGKASPTKGRQIVDLQFDGDGAATARAETDKRAETGKRADAEESAKADRAGAKARRPAKARSETKRASGKKRAKASPARVTRAKKKRRSAPRRSAPRYDGITRDVTSLGVAGKDAPDRLAQKVDKAPAAPVAEEKASLIARRSRGAKPDTQIAKPAPQPDRPAPFKAKVSRTESDDSAPLREQAAQFAPPPPADAGGDAPVDAPTVSVIAAEGSIKRADDRNADRGRFGQIGEARDEREEEARPADDLSDLSVASITPRGAVVTGDLVDAKADDFDVGTKDVGETARGLDVEEAPVAAKATVAPMIVVESPRRTASFDSGALRPMGDSLSVGGGALPRAAPTQAALAPIQATAAEPESVRIASGSAGAGRARPRAENTATVPLLSEARAARSQGDHRAAVSAYARYFQRHPRDGQFSRGLFEAAASYEALGQLAQAIRMYGLIPSTAGQLYARARARIGALRAARDASAVKAPPELNEAADRDVVDPMPLPPNVNPPR